jgi:hypothetical protein
LSPGYGFFTSTWSTTFVTPSVSVAKRTARSRCALESTVPVNVTTDPAVRTLIVRASPDRRVHLRLDLRRQGAFAQRPIERRRLKGAQIQIS